MTIIPKKLQYRDISKAKKKRTIRKTNQVLKRMDKEALMVSVHKSNRHISIDVFDNYYNKLTQFSTTQYIDTNIKKNRNYCNISFAEKIALVAITKIKELKNYKNKIVFNSGPYKYHGQIKTIDSVIKDNL